MGFVKSPDVGKGAAENRLLPGGADSGGAVEEKGFFGGGAEAAVDDSLFTAAGGAAGRVNNPVAVEEEDGPFEKIPPNDEEDGAVPKMEAPGPGATSLASNLSLVTPLGTEPCC